MHLESLHTGRAEVLRQGDFLEHITALGIGLEHVEISQPEAATMGGKVFSQPGDPNSLPIGI